MAIVPCQLHLPILFPQTRKMSISVSTPDIPMSEQNFHVLEISARGEQITGKRMPEVVKMEILQARQQANLLPGTTDKSINTLQNL